MGHPVALVFIKCPLTLTFKAGAKIGCFFFLTNLFGKKISPIKHFFCYFFFRAYFSVFYKILFQCFFIQFRIIKQLNGLFETRIVLK